MNQFNKFCLLTGQKLFHVTVKAEGKLKLLGDVTDAALKCVKHKET